MEDLDLENLFSPEELAALETLDEPTNKQLELPEHTEETKPTEVENPEDLFGDEPESVGGENNNDLQENSDSKDDSNSPNNLYSSMTGYLVDEGVLSNLSDEDLSNVKSAEDFKELMRKHILSQLDETLKRVVDALNADIEPSLIKRYEAYLNNLNNIKEEQYTAENEQGENLRRLIIIQDLVNKGIAQERAAKMAELSFASGKDIDDAKEALQSIKDTVKSNYDAMIKEAQERKRQDEAEELKELDSFKKSVLEDSKVFGELNLDKSTRQKVIDSVTKVVYTDKETGDTYTAVEKFEHDDRIGFLKLVGLVYTLTDGGKDMSKLVSGKVKKEVSKHLSNLENVLNNTQRDSSGNLRFRNHNEHKDDDSHLSGWDIEL